MSIYSEYEQEILAEIDREVELMNPVLKQYRLVSFISRSNGRGRKPRKPREITLIVNRSFGYASTWQTFKFDSVATEYDEYTGETNDENAVNIFKNALLRGQSEP